MIGAELHVVAGKHSGQVIPLNRKKFLIGREQDCQLRPNSELVSRHHCIFSVDDYSVRLRDLGSTNGTVVNGERIQREVILAAGDHVVVGSLEFRLKLTDSVALAASQTSVSNEETVVGSGGTLAELQIPQTGTESSPPPAEQPAATEQPAAVEQTPVEAAPQAPGQDVGTGDTTVISQPAMMPGQQPYQPMMPQMGYGYPGQMYGGYPYQQQMPMYPGGYPQQMMPPGMQGYPQQPPQQYEQPAQDPAKAGVPDVALPDPSQTGAKDDAPSKGSGGAQKGNTEQSTGAADAIIQQYRNRRPGG